MTEFLAVHLLPLANVPAHCTQQMNAFTATIDENMALHPLAKLIWTLAV